MDDIGPENVHMAWDEHAFKLLGLAVVCLLTTGTIVYNQLEDWSWVDSFYFSALAVTTVGFPAAVAGIGWIEEVLAAR